MSCFGMGISLTPSEKAHLADLVDTAMFSTTMINDIHSWPKEIKHHIEHPGSEYPFNAVAILMRHQGCSEAEAVRLMRQKQASLQEQHLTLLRRLGPLPEHQMLYVLAAQYAASGSEFWSIHVPRYPSKEDLKQPEVEFVDGVFQYNLGSNGPAPTPLFQIGREAAKNVRKDSGVAVSVAEIHVDDKNHVKLPTTKTTYASALKGQQKPVKIIKSSTPNNTRIGSMLETTKAKTLKKKPSGRDSSSSSSSRTAVSGSETSDYTDVVCTDEVNHFPTPLLFILKAHHGQNILKYSSEQIIMAPYKYLTSMPSKGIRDLFITALNWWLEVPETELLAIKDVVGYLHQSSLM